jgi:hypothetical protein
VLDRSDFRAGTIPSKFNIVERGMGKQQAQTSNDLAQSSGKARCERQEHCRVLPH